jgi:hypothetical protein
MAAKETISLSTSWGLSCTGIGASNGTGLPGPPAVCGGHISYRAWLRYAHVNSGLSPWALEAPRQVNTRRTVRAGQSSRGTLIAASKPPSTLSSEPVMNED